MERVIIREARRDEFDDVLPRLAAKSYGDRFFRESTIRFNGEKILERERLRLIESDKSKDEFLEYSGSLSVPFSCLRPQESGAGQSFESFRRYWVEKKGNPNFKVFVAEVEGKVIGFVKGTFDIVDCVSDFPDANLLITRNVVSLGSLYVDPDFRCGGGIGTELTRTYMRAALESNPECEAIVTDCYWRNNSQYFFNKLGAVSVGFCNIPDLYLNERLERETRDIAGEVMFWSREKAQEFVDTPAIEKGRILADIPYSRNTPEYSLLTAADGNMQEFRRLKDANIRFWTQRVDKGQKESDTVASL